MLTGTAASKAIRFLRRKPEASEGNQSRHGLHPVLNDEKKLSITALSQTLPERLSAVSTRETDWVG
jgi:hypothetical protein